MAIEFDINMDEAVVYANKLEKMHRSALPVAARTALNSVAFDVKKRTLLVQAKTEFTERSKNFFKANSRVEMAKGFNLDTMQSKVGMVSENLQGNNNFAVKDLEQQEEGGEIDKKSFIPLPGARVGRAYNKMVRPANRLSKINRIVDVNKIQGASSKQRFIKAALRAGQGGFVLGNYRKSRILWRIDNVRIGRFRNNTEIEKTGLYDFRENRRVNVQATNFMREASLKSAGKMEFFFRQEAQKQIQRLIK